MLIESFIGVMAWQVTQKWIFPIATKVIESSNKEKEEKPQVDRQEENKKLRKKYGIEEK